MTRTFVVTCDVPVTDLDELKLTPLDHTIAVTGPNGFRHDAGAARRGRPGPARGRAAQALPRGPGAARPSRSDVAAGEEPGRERRRGDGDRDEHRQVRQRTRR